MREQIEAAVKEITAGDTRLVFLIDDLDRCHDPAQIVGLLEQIKLFLHLPRCLFFLAADRGQIIQAIESRFPGEGRRYLDKFVQLGLDLPQAECWEVAGVLPEEGIAPEDRAYLRRVAEVLAHNPRRLKTLWNRARLGLDTIREEMQEVTGFTHAPSLPLMLRWLLMQEAGLFQANPYLALALQAVLRDDERPSQREEFEALLAAGDSAAPLEDADPWRQWFRQRLRVFLWQDRDTHYESARVFALYLKASGAAYSVTRAWLEEEIYAGRREFAFLSLADEDLAGAHLRGAAFRQCDFTRANLDGADLREVRFEACRMEECRLDACRLEGVQFKDCIKIESVKSQSKTYEKLTDILSRPP